MSIRLQLIKTFSLIAISAALFTASVQASLIFTNNFDSTLPGEIAPGVATLTSVQGYAGYGPIGNQFGGSFLRSPTGNTVTLTLSNLPPHRVLNLSMLFGAIDSLDGTGTFPSGDFFTVTLDTNIVFRESFANASPNQIQSYVSPPGAELARHVDLGFSGPGGFYTDSAYNFTADARFKNLPHTNSVAVLTFVIEGPEIQDITDESWAMDNLAVSVELFPQPIITQFQTVSTDVVVTWSSVSNANYRVQSKTNLMDAVWKDLEPLVKASSSTAEYADPRGTGSRFYRVMAAP